MTDSLSIIVPVRNAEATLTGQVERLLEVLPDLTQRFDIVIVDDGSSDHTVELARELASEYPQVRLIRHDAPCGREHAIHTGRTWAQGRVILAPEDLAEFLRPAELRRQWLLEKSPPLPNSATPRPLTAKPPGLRAKWRQQDTAGAEPRFILAETSSRADEAHPRPPYLHHAAAFLEHLTRLALGE